MRSLGRLVLGTVSLVLLIAVLAIGGVAFLVHSEAGNELVRSRTQATITRLLGPAYTSDLGEQTFEMRPDGTLAIGWNGVTLSRTDQPQAPTAIDRVGFGIRLLPLVSGGLEFGRLEIEGADVDLAAFLTGQAPSRPRAERGSVSQMADGAVAALERQLAALSAFRFETVAFRDIAVNGLPPMPGGTQDVRVEFAELRRSGEGRLDLAADLSFGALPLSLSGEAVFDESGRLADVSVRSSPVNLGLVIPPGPADDLSDERPFGTDADLSVTLGVDRAADTDRLVSELSLTSGPGEIQAGRNRSRVEEMRLRLRHREGEERIELVESPMRFSGVSFDLAGAFEPVAADAAAGLRFRLGAADIASRIGMPDGGEPRHGTISAEGILSTSKIELTHLEFLTGGGGLSGSGVLDLSAPDARSRIEIDGADLDAASVKAFWPFSVAGRARRWVIANVGDEARVPNAEIVLDVARERFPRAFGRDGELRPAELRVDADLRNADLATFGELPRLYRANGQIRVRGSRTRVTAQDAMVEGLPALALGRSTVDFAKPRDGVRRDTLMSMRIGAAGAIPELLDIADREPIRALRSLDITPQDASGTAQVDAEVRLRLGEGIAPKDAIRDWFVGAELIDATVGKPIEGRRFANLTGSLDVDAGSARAALTGLMDDIPAEIALTMPVGAAPSVERAVEVDLDVSAETAIRIVPALSGVLDGPIAAKLTQGPDGLHARLDLTSASLAVPAIAWTKGSGVEATLDVDVVQNDGETRLDGMAVRGAGFSASGSAIIDGQGLRSARLSEIALNPGDSVALSMDRQANGFSMSIEGSQFDARPLLQELKANAGRERPAGASGQTFDIAASIDTVRGFADRALTGLTLNYASADGKLAALSVSGRAGAGTLRADVSPRSQSQSIRIATEDLGAFVGFAGLYGNMESGGAVLELSGTPDGAYQGSLSLTDFTLVDEPRLERFVGSEPAAGQGSLSQAVGRDLRTSRAYFDQASASLYYGDGRLSVANGILRGPIFGSSFEGTLYDRDSQVNITGAFMPAYTVNRIFGAIPLVGQILGNGIEGGLLGITYQLSGTFAEPTLTINPISIIAPGIFRQIFEY